MNIARALTIAGSDSSGGAGIQADLKTFALFDVYGSSAITAITAQNTLGINAVEIVTPTLVAKQIDAVLSDIGADAVKTGMLGTTTIIQIVAERLRHYEVTQLIVDPVMVAKGGAQLLEPSAIAALKHTLIPQALLITPNIPEAEILLGSKIATAEAMLEACRALHHLGSRYVLLKGGHLDGDPVDVLFDGNDQWHFIAQRIATRHTHGTGCTLAAAITARLAQGASVPEAIESAHSYVQAAIRNAPGLGEGHGPLGWRSLPNKVGQEIFIGLSPAGTEPL